MTFFGLYVHQFFESFFFFLSLCFYSFSFCQQRSKNHVPDAHDSSSKLRPLCCAAVSPLSLLERLCFVRAACLCCCLWLALQFGTGAFMLYLGFKTVNRASCWPISAFLFSKGASGTAVILQSYGKAMGVFKIGQVPYGKKAFELKYLPWSTWKHTD